MKYRWMMILTVMTIMMAHVPCSNAAKRLKVVTTFTIIADMAANVAGDVADVHSITKFGAEIHQYQPTPRDILNALDADIILWNGLNLELWFKKFLANLPKVPSVVVSEGVEPIAISQGPYNGKPNPHAWMSPSVALIYIDNIAKALAKADPDHAEIYATNAKTYKAQIRSVIEPIRESLATIAEQDRWLVTSEGAFSYLARDFNLKEVYLWPINADQQGTPKQVKHVIDTVRKHHIKVVFSESTVSDGPARQVARETGARYGGKLYVDSLSNKNGPVPTYLDLLKTTTQTIAKGLKS